MGRGQRAATRDRRDGERPRVVTTSSQVLAWSSCLASIGVIAGSVAAHGVARPGTCLALVVIAIVVQHRDVVVVQRESAFDAGLAVAVASVLVLGGHPGPSMVVGLAAGLVFLPQLRARSWTRLACNAGNFALSTFAAWCAASASSREPRDALALVVAALLAGVAYWVTNDGLGIALCAARDRGITCVDARRIVAEDARLLPLALVGAIAALAEARIGGWTLVMLVATPLAVEHAVVGRRRAPRPRPSRPSEHGVSVAIVASAIARELRTTATPATVDTVLATAEALVEGRVR